MAEKRNLCAMIPLDLFTRVGAERDKAGQTNSEFITNLLTEYFRLFTGMCGLRRKKRSACAV